MVPIRNRNPLGEAIRPDRRFREGQWTTEAVEAPIDSPNKSFDTLSISHRQEEAQMSGKRMTKAQVIAEISEFSELDKKSVSRVFDGLTELIKKQLGSRGPGEFVIPGLLKLKAVKKPATKDRPGINPFTKQPITIKGKPASKKIRATALKALKDLIQ
jgi:nucleoid DNA-binding protein